MPLLRPGEGFRTFSILEQVPATSAAGRPAAGEQLIEKGYFVGSLTNATPKEKETWKQNGHEISHKIVQELLTMEPGESTAKPTQYLRYTNEEGNPRTLKVEGVENPGGLEHWLVYYVNLRGDMHGNGSVSTVGSGKNQN